MFKRASAISRNRWYLASDINDISKLRETKSTQAIVCFHKTFLWTPQVLFYYQGECIKATRSSLDASAWNHLMRLRTSTLGREANEIESSLLNKIMKGLLKTTDYKLSSLEQAIRDDQIVDCLIPGEDNHEHDHDEDTVDGCVIS